MKVSTSFILTVILAFASAICFFQIDSSFADKHVINWLFISGGILFGSLAGFMLYVTWKNSRV